MLFNAVTAYMNVVRDAAVLELNLNNEKVLQAQLDATQARFEVGELTRTDVAQAEARLQGAVAARIQAEGVLTGSRAIYRQVVGEDPVDVKMPEDRPKLPSSRDESAVLSRGARHLFLVPWRDYTHIGVNSKVFQGHPDAIAVTEAEIDGFLAEINDACPDLRLTRDDVLTVNAGLLPFGDNGEGADGSTGGAGAVDSTARTLGGIGVGLAALLLIAVTALTVAVRRAGAGRNEDSGR